MEVTNVLGESRQSRQRGCATQICAGEQSEEGHKSTNNFAWFTLTPGGESGHAAAPLLLPCAARKKAMNYSKWDNLEDSDDEEDTISKANKVNERAATALGKKKPAEALKLFEEARALLLPSGKPSGQQSRDLAGGILLNMAVASHQLGKHDDVVRHADAALALEPNARYDRGQIHMWRAAGLQGRGELQEAKSECTKALSFDPQNGEAGARLKQLEVQLAERDYDARDATATECNRLVEACDGELNAERWAAAKAKIEEALPLMTLTGEAGDRKRATLLQRLGIATAKLGDKEGALKVFAEAIELLDKYPKADLGLREALSQWVVGLSPRRRASSRGPRAPTRRSRRRRPRWASGTPTARSRRPRATC